MSSLGRMEEAYEWSFSVPLNPRKKFGRIAITPTTTIHLNASNLRFTRGLLRNLDHHWAFKIHEGCVTIKLRIHEGSGFRFAIHPSEVQLIGEGQATKHIRLVLTDEDRDDHGYLEWSMKGVFRDRFPLNLDTLRVILNIQSHTAQQSISDKNSDRFDLQAVTTTDNQPPILPSNSLISRDFFMSEFLSDVILVSGGQEFPAHRFLLACKSPVFKCMFEHQMKESIEGRVTIEDIEPKVLRETLHFIYTGKFEADGIEDLCVKLLESADKYQISTLKSECVRRLVNRMRVENALEIYILGDTYNEPILMKTAVLIMKRDKKKSIPDELTHQEITLRYPKLAYQLFLT